MTRSVKRSAFIDGTFFSCPSLFYQLTTISIVKDGCSFNVAYFLLPGKYRDVYVEAFEHFRNAVVRPNLSVSLQLVRTDFEIALLQALLFILPGTRHRGCHFHFSQAIWRNVQELGLSAAYRSDLLVAGFVRKMISLAFIPPSFVRVAWGSLKLVAPSNVEIPRLILYFEDT